MALESWRYRDPALVYERIEVTEDRDLVAKRKLKQLFEGNMREQDFKLRISVDWNNRLENWGWIMRPRLRQGISPTAIVCQRLATLAGAYKFDDRTDPPSDVQKADALSIERAWRNPLMPLKEKTLLAGYYIYRVHPHKLSRAVALRYADFDQKMFMACNMLENITQRLASRISCRDNGITI